MLKVHHAMATTELRRATKDQDTLGKFIESCVKNVCLSGKDLKQAGDANQGLDVDAKLKELEANVVRLCGMERAVARRKGALKDLDRQSNKGKSLKGLDIDAILGDGDGAGGGGAGGSSSSSSSSSSSASGGGGVVWEAAEFKGHEFFKKWRRQIGAMDPAAGGDDDGDSDIEIDNDATQQTAKCPITLGLLTKDVPVLRKCVSFPLGLSRAAGGWIGWMDGWMDG